MTQVLDPRALQYAIANPMYLVRNGYLRVKTDKEVLPNGKMVTHNKVAFRPFRPKFAQGIVVYCVEECRRRKRPTKIIGVKARRDGLSAIASAIIAADNCLRDLPLVSTISNTEKQLDVLNRTFLVDAFQQLPPELGVTFSREVMNPLRFTRDFNHDTGVPALRGEINLISAEAGLNAGIGTACLHAWITEYAYFKNGSDVMEAFGPTLMDSPEAFTFKESAGMGKKNLHYEEFMFSWERQGRVNPGPNSTYFNWDSGAPEIAVFFPWYYGEERVLDLMPGVTPEAFWSDLDDYEKEIVKMRGGLFDFARENAVRLGIKTQDDLNMHICRQLHWLRAYSVSIPEFGYINRQIPLGQVKSAPPTKIARYRAAPSTVDEAFTDDNTMVFGEDVLKMHQHNVRDAVTGILDESGRFIPDVNPKNGPGWLRLWMSEDHLDLNVKDTLDCLERHQWKAPRLVYFMGADFAAGDFPEDDKADFSACVVFTLGDGKPKQVASLVVKEKVPHYEDKLKRLKLFLSGGQKYRRPYECAESSNMGRHYSQMTTDPLSPTYDNQDDRFYYSRRAGDDRHKEIRDKPGFEAGMHTLNMRAWQYFEGLMITDPPAVTVRDARIVDQMGSLIRKTNGLLEAQNKGKAGRGSKDDICDAAKMALWHMSEVMSDYSEDLSSAFNGMVDEEGKFTYMADDELDPMSEEYQMRREVERRNKSRAWFQQRLTIEDIQKERNRFRV